MKKSLILILAAVCSAVSLKAQTQKGSQLLGGSFSFSAGSSNTDNYPNGPYDPPADSHSRTTSLAIGPAYSYFIADKLDIGAAAIYQYGKQKNTFFNTNYTTPQDVKTEAISTSLYLRKYFLYKDKFGFRAGPSVSYIYSNSTTINQQTIYNNYLEQRMFQGGLNLDLVYFPARRLGLASYLGTLAYTHSRSRGNSYTTDSSGFNANLVSSVNLSIFYSFGK